jgi:uncharacterized membrane protein YfcA
MNLPLPLIPVIAFAAEYIDSSLGMGYGTTLVPVLILFGCSPLLLVPAVLLSELCTGLFAAIMHHKSGNVHFDFSRDRNHPVAVKLGKLGYIPRSLDSKIALLLGLCSFVGATSSVFVAVHISAAVAGLIIGIVVLAMGILILHRRKKESSFSWRKITVLGTVAAFNKGLSGGGYGPLVTAGQILSGVDTKSSVAITSLAESITCLVGFLAYLALNTTIDWRLILLLIPGAMAAVPFAAKTVKLLPGKQFMIIVGICTTTLGILTILKAIPKL